MGITKKFTLFDICNYTFMILFTLACFFPFYYLFINTISSNQLSSNGEILFYPRGIQFSNYMNVFRIPGILQATYISVARTVLGTAATVLASAFLGFLFTKKMWGRKFWYRFMVITMYFNAGLIPWFIIMHNLKLTDNFLAYILPVIVQPFNIILVKTFVESTPVSLQEAAMIDGAGTLRIFWKIIVPIITPILATIAIFTAVNQWNTFFDTLFLISNPKLFTLQFILWRYMNEATSLAQLMKQSTGGQHMNLANMPTATSIRTTVSMVVVAPILLVYPFFQRFFVKGIMLGAVKG